MNGFQKSGTVCLPHHFSQWKQSDDRTLIRSELMWFNMIRKKNVHMYERVIWMSGNIKHVCFKFFLLVILWLGTVYIRLGKLVQKGVEGVEEGVNMLYNSLNVFTVTCGWATLTSCSTLRSHTNTWTTAWGSLFKICSNNQTCICTRMSPPSSFLKIHEQLSF